MIEVQNITKSFDDKQILKGISTIFSPGIINMVIGTSGSGKTVFMKCLVGLFQPDTGSILYNGIDFTRISIKEKNKFAPK